MIVVKNISQRENHLTMQMQDGVEILCRVEGEVGGDTLRILSVAEFAPGAAADTVRAALHAGELRGALWARCGEEIGAPLRKLLGFQKEDRTYFLSLREYFIANCNKK